jgi:hypothetical protein
MKYLKNAISLGIVVSLTAVAIYAGVEMAAAASTSSAKGTTITSAAAPVTQTYVCPRTGCSATTCHAANGTSPYGDRGGAVAQSQGGTGGGPSGDASAGNSGSGSTQTCPRTGCNASYCHGTNHESPAVYRQNGSSGGSTGYGYGDGATGRTGGHGGHGRHSEGYGGGVTSGQSNGITY